MAGLVNAVLENRPRQVILYLKLGSDVNLRSPSSRTLLMLACHITPETAALKMTKLLLKYGANTRHCDNKKRNALMHAVLTDKLSVANYLVENFRNFDLNETDSDKNTALHLAARTNGSVDIAKTLVNALRKYKLSLSIRNSHGRTPLVEAIVNNNTHVELFLREVLASKNVPNERFGSALLQEFISSAQVLYNENKPDVRPMAKRRNNTALSKIPRSKTMPVVRIRGNREIQQFKPESRVSSCSMCSSVNESCHTFGITKLYETWQDQLCPSYQSSAVPIYEEYFPDQVPYTISVINDSIPSFIADLAQRSLSQFHRSKSSMELGCWNSQSQYTTGKPTLSVNTRVDIFSGSAPRSGYWKKTGQPSKSLSYPSLHVPTDRRSRSASPRPVIML